MWYGYSFFGLELGSSFSPPLMEDLQAPAFFFPSIKEMHYFFRHCRHMARQWVCVTKRFDFSTAFTVDLLKHLWDQDRDLVLDEIFNSQLFRVPVFSSRKSEFQLAFCEFASMNFEPWALGHFLMVPWRTLNYLFALPIIFLSTTCSCGCQLIFLIQYLLQQAFIFVW